MRLASLVLAFVAASAAAQPALPSPPSLNDFAQLGAAVAVDGDRALVGAPGSDLVGDDVGAAYVYERDAAGAWALAATLTPSDGGTFDSPTGFFGVSVALDGDRALVGAPRVFGAAYVYDFDGTDWVERARIEPPGEPSIPDFGEAVALDGDRAVVGAPDFLVMANGLQYRPGGAWVYERLPNGLWAQTADLRVAAGSAPEVNGQFGGAVAIDGDRIVVADRTNDLGGAAFFLDYDGSAWALSDSLRPPPNAGGVVAAVDLDGDRAVFTASFGSSFRRAYFAETTDGTTWSVASEFAPTFSGGYGASVALDGGRAVVGAPGENRTGQGPTGALYTYAHNGGAWESTGDVTPNPLVVGNAFARRVALRGTEILVGAPEAEVSGFTSAGQVLVTDGSFATSAEPDAGPFGLALAAPMPNPARGAARLRLSASSPQPVRVSVHDLLGREVAVAFDGTANGEVEAVLDTRPLAVGLYVVRARGRDGVVTRRLSVVR